MTNNFASQVNADWNATSGVAQILNKPSIPTQSDIQAMINQSVAGLSTQIAQQQAKIDSLIGTRPTVTIQNSHQGDKINFPLVTAQVTNTQGELVLAKGFCWSTSQNPTIQSGNYVIVDTATSTFKAELTSLTSTTQSYYVRAFATSASGTSYSNPVVIQRANYYAVPRSGSQTITLNPGDEIWVYDIGGPSGNYNEYNLDGRLTIKSGNSNYNVRLAQGTYTTESNYDYLELYECHSYQGIVNCDLLDSYSGNGTITPRTASWPYLTLRFRTDNSVANYAGFAAKFVLVQQVNAPVAP